MRIQFIHEGKVIFDTKDSNFATAAMSCDYIVHNGKILYTDAVYLNLDFKTGWPGGVLHSEDDKWMERGLLKIVLTALKGPKPTANVLIAELDEEPGP